jgi:hypothetical protein
VEPLPKATRDGIEALTSKVGGVAALAKKEGLAYLGKFPVDGVSARVFLVKKGRKNQTGETDIVKNEVRLFLNAFSSLKDLEERLPRLLEHEASHVRDHVEARTSEFESPTFLRAGRKVREAIQRGKVRIRKDRNDLSVGARSEAYARDVINDILVQQILHDGKVRGERAQLAVLATALRDLPGKDVKKDYANSTDEIRAFIAEAASEIRAKVRSGADVKKTLLASKTWKHVKQRMTGKNKERFVREVEALMLKE